MAKKPSAGKSAQHGGKIALKGLQNGSKMVTRWLANRPWRPLGGVLGASWGPPGALKKRGWLKGGLPGAYGALLDASWVALGAEKRSLERLLAAPRGIPRQVSAILGAKRLPKGRPRGFKIESKRRLELKTRFLQKVLFFYRISLIFEVPGSLFGGQNRYKMASDCSLVASCLPKAF